MSDRRVDRTRRLGVCLLSAAGLAVAASALAREPVPTAVQDLDYGEVLFHFHQGDQFGALARLLAADKLDRIDRHRDDAELLLGGLYLSFGLHDEAAETFARLLNDSVPPVSRDRAWYYLANIRAQRGFADDALSALERVGDALPEELAAQKLMLHARVLMQLDRPTDAVTLLDRWKGPDDWRAYARFNLGVALVSAGRTAEGLKLLEKTGSQRKARTPEAEALRDRANLALGFTRLRDGDAEGARPALQRVRLEGPFSNKALLGLGWADSALEQYERALVPWQVLAERGAADPAVQESLLAVPHALAQLDAQTAAAQGYLDAVDAFEQQLARIDELTAQTEAGGLPDRLLANDRSRVNGWFWRLDEVPASLESRYLADLLADDGFQEGLQDYRDLRQAADNLKRWRRSLAAYDTMLRARQARFDARLPAVDAQLAGTALADLSDRAEALGANLDRIATENDLMALATADEAALWQRVGRADQRLQALGASAPGDADDKLRLYRGLMLWNANAAFPGRLWEQRKGLREVHRALEATTAQHASLAAARNDKPAGFDAFDGRIRDAERRIDALYLRTAALLADQEETLVALALTELNQRRQRLEAYRTEARFALATIYDRAAETSLGAAP